ncbi:MAG: hydrogenase maturation nickel metallochaperone HypA [Arthrobacter sp.]|uniref:hydrogenase maturation nickel metallochaperone HypA/HybF n=1 Tax=Arthrobacter sp. TaxID=1667 RepID=UPI00339AF659
MHELSITQSLIEAVLDRIGERRVVAVNVQVGPLSGVLPDAMRFCFDVASAGTPLADAQLVVDEPRGLARCRSCHEEFELSDLILLCPCGSADVEVLSGRELMLVSVEVA